jgi:hypothetical protein
MWNELTSLPVSPSQNRCLVALITLTVQCLGDLITLVTAQCLGDLITLITVQCLVKWITPMTVCPVHG